MKFEAASSPANGLKLRLIFATILLCLGAAVYAQPTLTLTPITINGVTAPAGYYTWDSKLGISSAGWRANSQESIHLFGPLNTAGVTPVDRVIGSAYADVTGKLVEFVEFNYVTPSMYIPYDEVNGLETTNDKTIPRPGSYTLRILAPNAQTIFDQASIGVNIGPSTISEPTAIPWIFQGWPRFRGAREGWLGTNSPERADPEWVSIWSEQPVSLYATIAHTSALSSIDDPPANQPSFIAHADLPFTHYGHDVNMELLPDPEYLWTLGTANFTSETQPGKANFGKVECEWETLNNGTPFFGSYGKGNIGMPLFVMPTAGDRVFMVGRWVLDNGHPDAGDRTEIHPVRMLATIRQRNTAVPFKLTSAMTRASQVDVYVSGHGGGSNRFPDGLSEALDNDGQGGGVTYSALDQANFSKYYAFGPADNILVTAIADAYRYDGKGIDPSLILPEAGPSGLNWLAGSENRPVNDMNYDFDVPLPPPPAGATTPLVQTTVQPGNTTAVKEVITYTDDLPNGLPTNAHIHLPYLGADSGIYAKTLNFSWDVFSPPGNHYLVQLGDVRTQRGHTGGSQPAYYSIGPLYLWTDVCGQWASLTDADPADLNSQQYSASGGPGIASFVNNITTGSSALNFDVYLDNADTLRVFTSGYGQRSFDNFFGNTVGLPAYSAGLHLAVSQEFDTGENINLGGALFDQPIATAAQQAAVLGGHWEPTMRSITTNETEYGQAIVTGVLVPDPLFGVDFYVSYVPRPPILAETGLPANFGKVCFHTTGTQVVQIANNGEAPLMIKAVSVTGAGFSTVPATFTPITIAAGQTGTVTVAYTPQTTSPVTGAITFLTNDPLNQFAQYSLSGTPGFSVFGATAPTTRATTAVVGSGASWPVTITNTGTCTLTVAAAISGAGYSVLLPSSYYNPITGKLDKAITVLPGATNNDLHVVFHCTSVAPKFLGGLTLTSNDPVTKTKVLVFGAEGVRMGMRVLVLESNGTPCPTVDQITLTGGPGAIRTVLTNVPLTTITPPTSWEIIRYHYTAALAAATSADEYTLTVKVGNVIQTTKFALSALEFDQIVIKLPSSG